MTCWPTSRAAFGPRSHYRTWRRKPAARSPHVGDFSPQEAFRVSWKTADTHKGTVQSGAPWRKQTSGICRHSSSWSSPLVSAHAWQQELSVSLVTRRLQVPHCKNTQDLQGSRAQCRIDYLRATLSDACSTFLEGYGNMTLDQESLLL